jgi:hypothetical protein
MAQRIMTLDNIGEFTICELLESVKQDVKRLDKHGFKFYMLTWLSLKGNLACTACLGGAAILGFVPDEKLKELWKIDKESVPLYDIPYLVFDNNSKKYKSISNDLACMMNSVRTGNLKSTLIYYEHITYKQAPKNLLDKYEKFQKHHLTDEATKTEICRLLDNWIKLLTPHDF